MYVERKVGDKRAMEILDKLLDIIADECTWELRLEAGYDPDLCFADHLRGGLMWAVKVYANRLGRENAEYIMKLPKKILEELERHYREYLEDQVEWYRMDDDLLEEVE